MWLKFSEPMKRPGQQWRLAEIKFNKDLEALAVWNVRFELFHPGYPGSIRALMKFTLDDLEFVRLENERGHPGFDDFQSALNARVPVLKWLLKEG